MKRDERQAAFLVKGMTCNQCERAIFKGLMAKSGIHQVKVSYLTGRLEVGYDAAQITPAQIETAVDALGYTAVSEQGQKSSGNLTGPQLFGILIGAAALYMLVDRAIGFDFLPTITENMGYGMLFLAGVLTSVHCIAMCGGINLSQSLVQIHTAGAPESAQRLQSPKWMPSLKYNMGRVISYTLIGGIVGALGSVVSLSGGAKGLMALVAGGFMILMGINMLDITPALRKYNIQMPKGLKTLLTPKDKKNSPLVVGMLSGLMPCGPLQAMQLYALGTGSFAAGALSMLAFSLGTVPLMLGFGIISNLLSRRFTKNMLKAGACLVILLGVVMLDRGMSLSGYSGAAANSEAAEAQIAAEAAQIQIEDGYQLISGQVDASGYPRLVLQAGVPAKVTFTVAAEDITGCNNRIVFPMTDEELSLQPGENTITLPALESGKYRYSCWMGMIKAQILVVEK